MVPIKLDMSAKPTSHFSNSNNSVCFDKLFSRIYTQCHADFFFVFPTYFIFTLNKEFIIVNIYISVMVAKLEAVSLCDEMYITRRSWLLYIPFHAFVKCSDICYLLWWKFKLCSYSLITMESFTLNPDILIYFVYGNMVCNDLQLFCMYHI